MPPLTNTTHVLVLGARGMLGSDLCTALSGRCRLTAWDIEDLDITDHRAVFKAIAGLSPNEVINCAAFTDVDAAEEREAEAMAVNGEAPGHLAAACAAVGARLVHIGSDYVFNGEKASAYVEEDTPNPLGVYGRSKLAGEEAIRAAGGSAAVVRTQWLYGKGGRNFVDSILRLATEDGRKELRVVNDQFGRPTWSWELATALVKLLESDAEGTYHIAASGECSWFDVAAEIVQACGLAVKVTAVSTSEFPRPAPRPAYSVLDCSRAREELGIELRHWREALRDYLILDKPIQ